MKRLTKIQSISDIITNSSSEVFIMHKQDAEYWEKTVPFERCTIQEIDEQWVLESYWDWEAIFEVLGLDKNQISYQYESSWSWGPKMRWAEVDKDLWELWVDNNIGMLREKLFGLYWVDIEDHFEDAYDVIDEAAGDSLWHENRH